MCGRYGLYDISEAEIHLDNTGYDFKPNYNVAPTQTMPVVAPDRTIKPMKWGIHRVVGPKLEKDIINTRSDKAFSRFWGKTVRTKRCLIPANGFYEWRRENGKKVPYWIHPKDRKLLMFAGIYDLDETNFPHYSIMTTDPNAEMEAIHNRMPVMLLPDQEDIWLDESVSDEQILEDLLKPYPDGSLDIYEVSTAVNIVRNNNGDLMLPVNSK